MRLGDWLGKGRGKDEPGEAKNKPPGSGLSRRAIITRGPVVAAHAIASGTPTAPATLPGLSDESARLTASIDDLTSIAGTIVKENQLNENATKLTLEQVFERMSLMKSTGHADLSVLENFSGDTYLDLSLEGVPEVLTLRHLKDPKIVGEALRLGSEYKVDEDVRKKSSEQIKAAVEILQRITKLDNDATVADLREVVNENVIGMARTILDAGDSLPPMGSDERLTVFKDLRNIIYTASGLYGDSELQDQLTSEFRKAEAAKQMRPFRAIRTTHVPADAPQVPRLPGGEAPLTENISDPKAIKCSVESTARKKGDEDDAKVFLIKPKREKGDEKPLQLTRMHIQHLRQLLTVGAEKKLDNFDPASTQVETAEGGIRVSTKDKNFQNYLASFVGSREPLLIPNRLQTVMKPENIKESE